jgi:hypothetical protein
LESDHTRLTETRHSEVIDTPIFGFGDRHVVHGDDTAPEGPLPYQGRTNLDTLAWWTGRLSIGVFDDDRRAVRSIGSWSRARRLDAASRMAWGCRHGMLGVEAGGPARHRSVAAKTPRLLQKAVVKKK